MTELGRRLKKLRRQADMSSRELAALIGLPASTYQKYEDRRRKPHLPLAITAKLVNALKGRGVAPEEIWALADRDEVEAFLGAWATLGETGPAFRPAPVEADWRTGFGGRRRHERWNPLPAQIALDGKRHPCVVKDISPSGACVLAEATSELQEAAEVLLQLANYGDVPARVTHRTDSEIRLQFSGSATVERDMAAWLAPMRDI